MAREKRHVKIRRRVAGVVPALCTVLALSSVPMTARAEEPAGAGLGPNATVGDLLRSAENGSEDEPGSTASSEKVFSKLLGAVGTLIVVAVLGVMVYRRRLTRRVPGGTGQVEVVERASLSPRHAVYIVRLGKRLAAVGVSGDRMTLLTDMGPAGDDDSETRREGRSREDPFFAFGPRRGAEPVGASSLGDPSDRGGSAEFSAGSVGSVSRLRGDEAPEVRRLRERLREWKETVSRSEERE